MILITGAAGFIGSATTCILNRRGITDIILCDRFLKSNNWKNIPGLRFREFISPESLFDFLQNSSLAGEITGVIHLGACADTTEEDLGFLIENNVNFSIRLCRWALDKGKRFIYASSAAVYGDGSKGFSDSDELTPRLVPLNKYGFSKWMFDMWVIENRLMDSIAGLRYFNVFGPNEYHKGNMASVVFRTFPQALNKGKILLFASDREDVKDGEQKRDFIYIDEAVDITLFLFENCSANGIFNAGTATPHTFRELAESVFEGIEKKPSIQYFQMPEELRGRYQYYTKADMSRLFEKGYKPGGDRFRKNVLKYIKTYLKPGMRHMAEVLP